MSKVIEIVIDGKAVPVGVRTDLLEDAEDFFAKMDEDMDKGWQMGRLWVEQPNPFQKAQIIADKILGAVETQNKNMLDLMLAYMAKRYPKVVKIDMLSSGEMQEIEIYEQ